MNDTVIDALRRGDVASAVALAQQDAAEHPDVAEAHHALGLSLRMAGRLEDARVALDRAIELAPENAVYHLSRAGIAITAGDMANASTLLARVVSLDPNNAAAYVAQSQIALAAGDVDEAEQRLLRAQRVAPEDPQVLLAVGNLRLARGDVDGSLKALNHAVKLQPNNAAIQSALGVSLLRRGMHAFAEQALTRALELAPQMPAPRMALVDALSRQQKFAEAAAALRPLLEHGHLKPEAWTMLGDFEARAGRDDAALDAYERALAQAPGTRPASALVAHLRKLGRQAEAKARLDALLDENADDALWSLRLGLERGDRAGVRTLAERWQSLRGDSAAANETLAQILEAAGEREQAEALADRALARDPDAAAAALVKARAELHRAPEDAAQRLRPLADSLREAAPRRAVLGWLGQACDRAGRREDAVRHWLTAHALGDATPLPQLGDLEGRLLDTMAALGEPRAAPGAPPQPTLLIGAPGSGVERVAAIFRGQSERPLLDDRFTADARADRFRDAEFSRYLDVTDDAAVDDFVRAWRTGLETRGLADVPSIDWLQRWDARLMPVLLRAAPDTRIVAVIRDPRDTLLNWLAFGAPQRWAIADVEAAARWLALALAHVHFLKLHPRLQFAIVSIEDLTTAPEQVIPNVCRVIGLTQPPEPSRYLAMHTGAGGHPTAFESGHWRQYREVLAAPFAALTPVIRAFGYPED